MFGKHIKSRVREVAAVKGLREAVEANAEFVGQGRRKRVVLVDRHEVELVRLRQEECRQRGCVVDSNDAVIDVAAADLIVRRDVIVHALVTKRSW